MLREKTDGKREVCLYVSLETLAAEEDLLQGHPPQSAFMGVRPCWRSSVLLKPDHGGVLSETSSANHQLVLSDESVSVVANSAGS